MRNKFHVICNYTLDCMDWIIIHHLYILKLINTLYSIPLAFASWIGSSKNPSGKLTSSVGPITGGSVPFLESKKSEGTPSPSSSRCFIEPPAGVLKECLFKTGSLEIHSLPSALLFAFGAVVLAGVGRLFFKMDFWGALFRFRKALVFAASKKFSGTPALRAILRFSSFCSSAFRFFSSSNIPIFNYN